MKKSFIVLILSFVTQFVFSQQLQFNPDSAVGTSGETVTVSIVANGFNTIETAPGAIEFYIDFNNNVVSYTGVNNFTALLPENQWFYSSPGSQLNRFSCNWASPTLTNVQIPDGTVLFDLKFSCLAGETILDFDSAANIIVNIDGINFNQIPTNYIDGAINVVVGIPTITPHQFCYSFEHHIRIKAGEEGIVRIYDLAGHIVSELTVQPNEEKSVYLQREGVYIVEMQSNNKLIVNQKVIIK